MKLAFWSRSKFVAIPAKFCKIHAKAMSFKGKFICKISNFDGLGLDMHPALTKLKFGKIEPTLGQFLPSHQIYWCRGVGLCSPNCEHFKFYLYMCLYCANPLHDSNKIWYSDRLRQVLATYDK